MKEKTSILSFRISPELKTKLETCASLQSKNLTEFVRDTLSHSQGEQVLEEARKEFTSLESDANAMNERISVLKAQYSEMIEAVVFSEKTLLNALESRREALKQDRLIESVLFGTVCFSGAILGSAGVELIRYLAIS
jgi:uncharacterized protein (DUF1778 family)